MGRNSILVTHGSFRVNLKFSVTKCRQQKVKCEGSMKEVYGKRERFLINSSLLILQETMAELVNPLTTRSDKHLASPNGLFFYVSGMMQL